MPKNPDSFGGEDGIKKKEKEHKRRVIKGKVNKER